MPTRRIPDLLDIPRLQEILDSLCAVSKLPAAVIDTSGNVIARSCWQDVCLKFHRAHPETGRLCMESSVDVGRRVREANLPVVYRCPFGLVDAATPIRIGGEHLGSVFTGQLFLAEPDPEFFRAQAREYGFDEESYVDAVKKVPVVTEGALQAHLRFVSQITGMLAEMGWNRRKEKSTEQAREATIELLRLCNEAGSLKGLMRELMVYFQRLTGCEAVGVRLKEGDDFPYYETRGFPEDFVLAENRLCARDPAGERVRDDVGHPSLDCMCGNILCGRYDPTLSFFSPRGSFWSNCTTELLANTTDADRQAKTRNRCNGEGYESVALVPLRSRDRTFGLFQFNDRRRGRFTAEKIALLEDLVAYVAIALAKLKTDEELFLARCCIDRASISIFRVAMDGRILDANENGCRALGYTRDELCSLTVPDVDPLMTRERWAEHVGYLRTHGSSSVESMLRRKDGTTSPIDVDVSRLEYRDAEFLIAFIRDITDRKQAEDAVRSSEKRYRSLFENMLEGCAYCRFLEEEDGSRDFVYLDVNEAFGKLTGLKDVVGKKVSEVIPGIRESNPELFEIYGRVASTGEPERFEPHVAPLNIWFSVSVYSPAKGFFVAVFSDITERRKLEEQLRHSQKMEAVGRLAGGIAHDFNNLLTVINGYSELLLGRVGEHSLVRRNVEEIRHAGERAESLTRQLLAFSRRQVLQPKVLDLNGVISNVERMLRRLIGEDVELRSVLPPALWPVSADPGQMEQILLNLAVNARDAMPSGGVLTLETANVVLDEAFAKDHPSVVPGPHVLLAVSDTGTGIRREIRDHIFEPFFTTKESGKGTGLGLATVYGIVKQSNGFISVYSEVGMGTTFRIHFPRFEGEVGDVPVPPAALSLEGTETVLVVEDENSVREIIERTLSSKGYRVLPSAGGNEALRISVGCEGTIDLLITDVVMPGMGGRELADRIGSLRAGMKVLFMSGYTENAITHRGVLEEGIEFLQKPFTPDGLLRKVRELLDRKGRR